MTDEIDGARLEAEGGEKLAAGDHVEVMAFVGLRVVRVVILDVDEKLRARRFSKRPIRGEHSAS